MITADLETAERCLPQLPGFAKALEFLRRKDIKELPDGKYEIDAERVYAMVQRYETIAPSEPKFEAHRKYTDVQFMAAGSEVIGWAPLEKVKITNVYDEEKDACFGTVPAGEWTPLRLGPGQLALLGPEDAHAPRLAAGEPARVIKIVIKVSTQR